MRSRQNSHRRATLPGTLIIQVKSGHNRGHFPLESIRRLMTHVDGGYALKSVLAPFARLLTDLNDTVGLLRLRPGMTL